MVLSLIPGRQAARRPLLVTGILSTRPLSVADLDGGGAADVLLDRTPDGSTWGCAGPVWWLGRRSRAVIFRQPCLQLIRGSEKGFPVII